MRGRTALRDTWGGQGAWTWAKGVQGAEGGAEDEGVKRSTEGVYRRGRGGEETGDSRCVIGDGAGTGAGGGTRLSAAAGGGGTRVHLYQRLLMPQAGTLTATDTEKVSCLSVPPPN